MHTATTHHIDHATNPADDKPILSQQFDDVDQQSEASILGMWVFLATEVMFFGGLLTAYAVYRLSAPREVALASKELNVALGCFNTVVLLTSSLTMALAVRASQLRARRELVQWLGLTMVLGTAFLGIKAIEWTADYNAHLIPGLNFQVPEKERSRVEQEGLEPGKMELFFVLYFFMTGLHAIHLIIGIVVVGVMAWLSWRGWFSGGGATQIEVTGLYWHFIDIVWVFLYPLLYLIDVHQWSQHISSVRTNINVFIALMVLLFATVGAAYLPLGRLHFPTAMAVATAKTMLIVAYFMHVKYSHRLTAVICGASFLWLGIMIALILTDYMTRSPTQWYNWVNIPGK